MKNAIKYGYISFCRQGKKSILMSVLFAIITVMLLVILVFQNICGIYQDYNENPYQDYYRLCVDCKTSFESNEQLYNELGISSLDNIYSGTWKEIQLICKYFYDIEDYTAEICTDASVNITPIMPSWAEDPGRFKIHGISDFRELHDFYNGNKTLIYGRSLCRADRDNNKDVCVISKNVAESNNIDIGDTIDITCGNSTVHRMKIVGIYRNNYNESDISFSFSYQLQDNEIFVPLSFFDGNTSGYSCSNFQIYVKNGKLISQIEEYINEHNMIGMGKAYFFKVSDLYSLSNEGVHKMQAAMNVSQYGLVILSSLLIGIISISDIITEKKEISVLLALGFSKIRIAISVGIKMLFSFVIGSLGALSCFIIHFNSIKHCLINILFSSSSAELIQPSSLESIQISDSELLLISNESRELLSVTSVVLPAICITFSIALFGYCVTSVLVMRKSVIKLMSGKEDVT